jgi:glycosyltransferase involved in cell wall biosynthesis
MDNSVKYSVVVPVFNEEEVVGESYRRLRKVMDALGETFEIIFVNDGCVDKTPDILSKICEADPTVRLINFSRNFGHQVAISAGMDYARGRAIVVIDADLQDPPEVIPDMIRKWKEGFDVVYGKRLKRKGESVFKRATASMFYRLLRSMTNVNIPVDVGDFRLIDRKVCDVMKTLREKSRFVRGLVSWAGFRQTACEYVREERFAGVTKYPLRKMMRFASDAIASFSYKPLKIAMSIGTICTITGVAYLLFVIFQALFTMEVVEGWSVCIGLTLLLDGIVLIGLGIVGEYIGRIYDESKSRPLYVVRDTRGFGEDDTRAR